MNNLYGDFGAPVDFKVILDLVSSDDIMLVYEGVSQLKYALQNSDEKSLNRFNYEPFSKKLIEVIQQPAITDISNELKLQAMTSIFTIMDTFPQHVGYMISINLAGAVKQTIEEACNMGAIDLVEECIKCGERISQEFPREILKQRFLQICFNMLDFFDRSVQNRILSILLNLSECSEQQEDFTNNILPILPHICNMIQSGINSDSDKEKIEKLSKVLARVSNSFLNFNDASQFVKMGDLFDQLSLAGVHETLIEILIQYSKHVQSQNTVDKNQINTDFSKHVYSEETIMNFLKVLQLSCHYSLQVVMQLTSAGMFGILEPLLSREVQDDHSSIVTDVLSLIQSMLPANETQKQKNSDDFEKLAFALEAKMDLNDGHIEESKDDFDQASQKFDEEKKAYFLAQDSQLHNYIAKNLLPKIFVAYSSQMNNQFRTKCLSLIQKILMVIPEQLLAIDPSAYTKFIHMILLQKQPQQVICCLELVIQLLESQYGSQLQNYFIRHGIKEYILEFTQEETIKQLNMCEQQKKHELSPKEFLQVMIQDRERIAEQGKQMSLILEDQNLPALKREEVQRMGNKSEDLLKSIDKKISDLQLVYDKIKVQKPAQTKKLGDQISELATKINQQFFQNEYQPDSNFEKLKQLADNLNPQNFSELAQVLSNGLTSYEFVKSGLQQSICQIFELKEDATEWMVQFKIFVNEICKKQNNQSPFLALLNLCHEQLSLAESNIFKEEQTQQVLFGHKGLIINLVYDESEESKENSLIYQKRISLLKQLKGFPIPMRPTEKVKVLEEILIQRVRTQRDIDHMLSQANRHLMQVRPSEVHQEEFKQEELAHLEEIIMKIITENLVESESEMNQEEMINLMLNQIQEWELQHSIVTDSFYKYIQTQVAVLIDQMAKEDIEEMEEADLPEEERELVMQELAQKTDLIHDMINQVKERAFNWEQFIKQDKTTQVTTLSEHLWGKIQVKEVELVTSHVHELIKHPSGFSSGWSCDRLSGSLACRSRNKKPMEGWRCHNCNFDLCLPCIQINKYFDQKNKAEVVTELSAIQKLTIEEIQKDNPQEVEILFYFNKAELNKESTFTEVQSLPNEQDESLGNLQQVMSQYDIRTVHFTVREKQNTIADVVIEQVQEPQQQNIIEIVNQLTKQFSIGKVQDTIMLSLQIIKVLWYVTQNSQLFLKNIFKLELVQDDFAITELLSQIKKNHFLHPQLDNIFQKIMTDPRGPPIPRIFINDTLQFIFKQCSYLFSFETKTMYLKIVNFAKIDPARSFLYIKQHIKKNPYFKREMPKPIERYKLIIDRQQSMVQQTLAKFDLFKKRGILEITYQDEEGTGLGPTLEFYNLIGMEIRADLDLWRQNTSDGMLFPKAMSFDEPKLKEICDKFALIGALVGKSILDDRLIDLPISKLMWDLVFDKKLNLFHLKEIDENLFTILCKLHVSEVKDFCLQFYDPSNDKVLLKQEGQDIEVNQDNIQEYIDLLIDSTFNSSVKLQIQAFKKGFQCVVPLDLLHIFNSDEFEELICGQINKDEDWIDIKKLSEIIITDHGFHQNSKAFIMFLRYITEIKPQDRSMFIQFLTGSPRLPTGGFEGLEPRLTVVLKKPALNSKDTVDSILPSVMTCQNYVKMPDYTSYEALKVKFDFAVKEGSIGFTLS